MVNIQHQIAIDEIDAEESINIEQLALILGMRRQADNKTNSSNSVGKKTHTTNKRGNYVPQSEECNRSYKALTLLLDACSYVMCDEEKPKLCVDDVVDICKTIFAQKKCECAVIIYLTKDMEIIQTDIIDKSGEEWVVVDIDYLHRRLLAQSNTARVIFAHNHIGGSICPSNKDHAAMVASCNLCSKLNIEICDSLIYANNVVYSMRYDTIL